MPPSTESHSEAAAALSTSIKTLTTIKDALETIPVRMVFESVISILSLVRDEMIDNLAFVELAKYCVRTCHVLKTATEKRGVGSLSEAMGKAIESLEKAMRCIESKVRECALDANYSQERHPDPILWKMEIDGILGVLDADLELDDLLMADGNEQCAQHSAHKKPSTSVLTVTIRSSSGDLQTLAGPPPVLDPERALQCLISGAIPQGEFPSLIEMVFSNDKATNMVGCLQGSDIQTLIDAIYKALESLKLAPEIRRRALKSLYKTCAGHVLLPRSLRIELSDGLTGVPLCRGGFGDVWKREYQGMEVAVKVLKTYADSDLQKITRRFCKEFVTWRTLRHQNVLPLLGVMMSETQFAMVSEWMPNGNINQYVKAHRDENRFELLGDVARGLIYMHEQRMVHGDLKGVNVLVDQTGHACLADFGLLTIISEATNSTASAQGGTVRWMSPELLFPENFGLKHGRPTKSSDCYALGMTVYEVLSGQVPFFRCWHYAVSAKVLHGDRPEWPRGAERRWFTDDVRRVLEHCWKREPDDRPEVENVLRCLEEGSRFWTPLSQMVVDPQTTDSPIQNSANPGAEGSTEESELSSLPQPPSPPLKALLYGVTNTSNRNESKSASVPDRVLSAEGLSQRILRRRITRSHREGLPQPKLSLGGRSQESRRFVVPGATSAHDEQNASVEALESSNSVREGITEKVFIFPGPPK